MLIVAAVALRVDAYVLRYTLSTDEAALARNILERGWIDLLRPLDYGQIAPPGYLLVEKIVVLLLGPGEKALRLFPFLCGLASLWLCWAVARRLLSTVGALVAFGLVGLSNSFAQHAGVAKPYSGDVAAALLILFLALVLLDPVTTSRQRIGIAIAGALTPLFSFASVFVLTGLAACCWWITRHDTIDRRRAVGAVAAVWIVGAAGGAIVGHLLLTPDDSAFMKWFWAPGFMPMPPKNAEDVLWLWYQFKKSFRWTLQYRASVGWIGLAAIGAWAMARRRGAVVFCLIAPLVLVIGASAFQLYPFIFGRLQLFLLPPLLILVAEGADWFRRSAPGRWRLLGSIPMLLAAGLAVESLKTSFRERGSGELRDSLQIVRAHWQADDRAYVHYESGQVFLYYASQLGFTPRDYTIGSCVSRASPMREIDTMRGRPRVWIVALGEDRTGRFGQYLDQIGVARESHDVIGMNGVVDDGPRGFVALYDLSASPDRPPVDASVLPTDEGRSQWACYGPFRPLSTTPRD